MPTNANLCKDTRRGEEEGEMKPDTHTPMSAERWRWRRTAGQRVLAPAPQAALWRAATHVGLPLGTLCSLSLLLYLRTGAAVALGVSVWMAATLLLVALDWATFGGRIAAERRLSRQIVPWGGVLAHEVRLLEGMPGGRALRLALTPLLGGVSVDLVDAGDIPAHPRGAARQFTPGRRDLVWRSEVAHTGERWGRFRAGPTLVVRQDLFGWMRATLAIGGAAPVTLLPPELALRRCPLAERGERPGAQHGRARDEEPPTVQDIVPWVPGGGASLRDIDWKATARQPFQRLMRRQYVPTGEQRYALIVDLDGYGGAGARPPAGDLVARRRQAARQAEAQEWERRHDTTLPSAQRRLLVMSALALARYLLRAHGHEPREVSLLLSGREPAVLRAGAGATQQQRLRVALALARGLGETGREEVGASQRGALRVDDALAALQESAVDGVWDDERAPTTPRSLQQQLRSGKRALGSSATRVVLLTSRGPEALRAERALLARYHVQVVAVGGEGASWGAQAALHLPLELGLPEQRGDLSAALEGRPGSARRVALAPT
jgi:hypothetical protein